MAASSSGSSYANISSNKSKWIACHLVREDESVSFTLSQDEIAYLVFALLKLNESDIVSIDSHSMKVIKIELMQHVNIEKHALTAQTEIREGLFIQAMKEVKRTRWVKINWVPADMEKIDIVKCLENFGQVIQGPFQTNFDVRDNAPALTQRLKAIKTNNRTVEMEILQVIDLSSWTEASLSDKTSMAATWHQAFSTHGLVGAM